jgi:CheY-like chemotaxis protein
VSDEPRGSRRRPLILVAEDYTDTRELFQEFLQLQGYDVITAADGADALDKARAAHPDLVLMDLSMPVLDGYEVTRALKQDERTRDIPVLAHSAHAMAIHTTLAREAGCDTVVPKPSPPQVMAEKIRAMLAASKPSR